MNVIWLQEYSNATIIFSCQSGRGAARLARLHGVQEVGGSNPLAPTEKTPAMESFFLHNSEISLRGTHAANTPSGHTSSRPDQERLQQLNLFFFPKALKSITTLRFRNQLTCKGSLLRLS